MTEQEIPQDATEPEMPDEDVRNDPVTDEDDPSTDATTNVGAEDEETDQ